MKFFGAVCITCLFTLTACRARPPVTPEVRCETGNYVESTAACLTLFEAATTDAERERLGLLALRSQMYDCAKTPGSKCQESLEGLWLLSDDPAELSTVVSLSQQQCLDGEAQGCRRAQSAAWVGRGTAVDGGASFAWAAHCTTCTTPWAPYEPPASAGWPAIAGGERLSRASQLAAAGGEVEARALIAAELAAGHYAGRELEAQAMRQAIGARRWAVEVAPYVTTDPRRALGVAEQLAARMPDDVKITRGIGELRAGLAAPALARMEQARRAGLPMTTWFHAARAAQLGAAVTIPRVDVAALWATLPSDARVTVPAACAWAQPASPASSGTALDVTASVTCTRDTSPEVIGTETYTTHVDVEVERTRVVKGTTSTATQDRTCTRENCIKMGNAGNTCFTERYVCGRETTGYTAPDTTATYKVKERVARDATRQVRRRTHTITITGVVSSRQGSEPFQLRRERTEIADLAAGGRTFSSSALTDLERSGAAEIGAVAARMTASLKPVALARELGAARTERDPLRAEEHALRAVTLGDPAPALIATYQLGSTVQAVLDGAAFARPASATLVAVTPPRPTVITAGYPLSHYPARPTQHADAAPVDRLTPLSRRSGQLLRRTELVIDRTSRESLVGVGTEGSTMTGVRIERGWNLSDEEFGIGFNPGFTFGAGSDDKLGSFYEARVGAAAGMRGESTQLLLIGAVGIAGIGIRDGSGMAARTTETQLIYGAGLRFGLDEGWSLDGRLWGNTSGPLGAGMYAAGQVLRRWVSGTELGIEISRRDHGDAARMTGVGLVFRSASELFE